ncbi:uncharacterized protein LAESUDRAFT_759626 [Laetiporus sulphureus 93-53]|uniref:Uncharacterized protein n=1 Tax=Laetiporus sulphureus 93-53 TaxID=1314785 RepID=A0A165E227_9APHY|nr:uncharacterized protein LAESUDRAFT_759626 [Laetiporus sulphureus 93-53]KZT06096.1 hypothetical protein LAESUDRAFT_759626 [Laetiporus sulphureus 93-53]
MSIDEKQRHPKKRRHRILWPSPSLSVSVATGTRRTSPSRKARQNVRALWRRSRRRRNITVRCKAERECLAEAKRRELERLKRQVEREQAEHTGGVQFKGVGG